MSRIVENQVNKMDFNGNFPILGKIRFFSLLSKGIPGHFFSSVNNFADA
jgi:hypothetical protein